MVVGQTHVYDVDVIRAADILAGVRSSRLADEIGRSARRQDVQAGY